MIRIRIAASTTSRTAFCRLPAQFSLASVADPNVIVETAKWAEDEDGLIVRLYEAAGGSTTVAHDQGVAADGVSEIKTLLVRWPEPTVIQ